MKKKRKITKGSPVRNITTGEYGVVLKTIGNPDDPFGYIVRTETGFKRWILRKKPQSKSSSKPS